MQQSLKSYPNKSICTGKKVWNYTLYRSPFPPSCYVLFPVTFPPDIMVSYYLIRRWQILLNVYNLQRWENRPSVTMSDFDKKLAETDSYLQILIDQVQVLFYSHRRVILYFLNCIKCKDPILNT